LITSDQRNTKTQNPNFKQISMTKIRPPIGGLENWNLEFICCLVLVIWNFFTLAAKGLGGRRG